MDQLRDVQNQIGGTLVYLDCEANAGLTWSLCGRLAGFPSKFVGFRYRAGVTRRPTLPLPALADHASRRPRRSCPRLLVVMTNLLRERQGHRL